MTVSGVPSSTDSNPQHIGSMDEHYSNRLVEAEQSVLIVQDERAAIASSPQINMAHVFFGDTKVPLTADVVGGKAANLQKLGQIEGINTPKWFVLTTEVFKQYLRDNNLIDLIDRLDILCADPEKNSLEITQLTAKIKEAIVTGKMSAAIFLKISAAYEELKKMVKSSQARCAVRSSGVTEDGTISSCAGLYDSFLNCQSVDEVTEAVKGVWASSFNERVVQERIRLRVAQSNCFMGVIVQEFVDARASGVVSTLVLSNNYPGIQIAANYGLGESVVSGEVSVDGWIIHPTKGYILEMIRGEKEFCHVPDGKKGTKIIEVASKDRERLVLSTNEAHNLAQQVARIKAHYRCEVDVEFAVGVSGELFILQTRPLVAVISDKVLVVDPKETKKHKEIARGLYSVPGVTSGKLIFISSWNDLATGKMRLTKDDIALAYVTTNTWSQYLNNIRGLVTREGSPSSHPILLCREKKIPCVIGIHHAFEELIQNNGRMVTIDGLNKAIYEGIVPSKEANSADLMNQFKSIEIRKWPNLDESLPHLLHNKMVVEHEGKYWRLTPTYRLTGFQLELNMRRFEVVPFLVKKEGSVKILAQVIDGYTCNEMVSFEKYVALFEGFELKDAVAFNEAQSQCMQDFIKLAETFTLDPTHWYKYIETYARFRAFIWLGGGFRSYAERRVDEIGSAMELPSFYLDECMQVLQAAIHEIDTVMHRDIYEFAKRIQHKSLPKDVKDLKVSDLELYKELEGLSQKYRFEHNISLDVPLDLNLVFNRVKQEIETLRSGGVLTTSKHIDQNRDLLPEVPELKEWLRLSIWNRILQSDAHHLDARAKAFVRPKLLELGRLLVEREILDEPEEVFACSVEEIAGHIKAVTKSNL